MIRGAVVYRVSCESGGDLWFARCSPTSVVLILGSVVATLSMGDVAGGALGPDKHPAGHRYLGGRDARH